MATKKKSAEIRRCVGSKTFGLEAHDAPPSDFHVQPSRKDGLGVMCKTHWRQYTNALRKAALARKAAGTYLPRDVNKPTHPADAAGEPELPSGETSAVTARRQRFEARLAKVGVASDAGQKMLEAAAKAAPGKADVEDATTT